ncbi:hypothetical protein BK816_02530 [Boudabousia tangfeifanii]|uniref:General stress protein 17M-like domain-containing protein n=1 Tax=Boudabousia tangfeifanii TaxID=1912795 RepID=A0A1D9MJ38_9ACTO|nr:general stress protein [Boudabousia tangfeifanii]AOZ72314.1 hypothetical protein BK816_02530 [Boudabousia tangfeifanii]
MPSNNLDFSKSAKQLPNGTVVASFKSHDQAQQALSVLAEAGFPVQTVSVVGTDLKLIEQVIGRITFGKVMAASGAQGIWLGFMMALIAIAVSPQPSWNTFALAMLIGLIGGLLFGVVAYFMRAKQAQVVSQSQVYAASYEVVTDTEVARAIELLAGVQGNMLRNQERANERSREVRNRPPRYGVRLSAKETPAPTEPNPTPVDKPGPRPVLPEHAVVDVAEAATGAMPIVGQSAGDVTPQPVPGDRQGAVMLTPSGRRIPSRRERARLAREAAAKAENGEGVAPQQTSEEASRPEGTEAQPAQSELSAMAAQATEAEVTTEVETERVEAVAAANEAADQAVNDATSETAEAGESVQAEVPAKAVTADEANEGEPPVEAEVTSEVEADRTEAVEEANEAAAQAVKTAPEATDEAADTEQVGDLEASKQEAEDKQLTEQGTAAEAEAGEPAQAEVPAEAVTADEATEDDTPVEAEVTSEVEADRTEAVEAANEAADQAAETAAENADQVMEAAPESAEQATVPQNLAKSLGEVEPSENWEAPAELQSFDQIIAEGSDELEANNSENHDDK